MVQVQTRPASRRQAELDAWLRRAAAGEVVDLASLRGNLRAPTGLLQQLAEAVLDSSVSIVPEGGLIGLRRAWAGFESRRGGAAIDPEREMTIVADPMAGCAAAILALVSPGRHVAVIEPAPPHVIEVVRRVGGMARTVSMRPTEWEFLPAEFSQRVGPQTALIIVSDPNPLSGQYLPDEARASILAAVRHFGCHVLLDQSARHSVVEEEDPGAAAFVAALGANCLRIDVPAASVLAGAASAAAVFGTGELIAPVSSAAATFGLGAGVTAQSVIARRFEDGSAIDDIATLNGIVASGRALMLDGLDDIGVLGLGGPGGWYVPIRASALFTGSRDIGEALAEQAGLGVLPLAPFYVEGSSDPYILMAYLRDAGQLEQSLERIAEFYETEGEGKAPLALPAPGVWAGSADVDDDEFDDEGYGDDDFDNDAARDEDEGGLPDSGDGPSVVEATGGSEPLVAPEVAEEPEMDASEFTGQAGAGEGDDEYLFRTDDGAFPPREAAPEPEVEPRAAASPGGGQADRRREPVLKEPAPAPPAQEPPAPEPGTPSDGEGLEAVAHESGQVVEMAEADAKYRAAMAGMSDGMEEFVAREDDEDATVDATGDAAEEAGDDEAAREPPRDSVILPFGRWRQARRARREQDEETEAQAQAPAPHEPVEEEPAQDPEEDHEIPVFKLSVPDIASPEISVRRDRPAPGESTKPEAPHTPDDVLPLDADDALPDTAPETGPETGTDEQAGDAREDVRPEDVRSEEGTSADRRPRDDRPFFFDDPVI